MVVANDFRAPQCSTSPIQAVAGTRHGCLRRKNRKVVGEHVDTPVVRVGAAETLATRSECVLSRWSRLLRRHRLTDPRTVSPVGRKENPGTAEGVPTQLPGHRPSGPRVNMDLLGIAT